MSQKFCQKCEKEIAQGKEIKFERVLEWDKHLIDVGNRYRATKYIYSPAKTAIYYFCPECYEKVEQEVIRRAKKQDRWEWIIAGLCILIGLVLVVALIWTRNR
jgi:uncharacterized protein YlaI